MARLVIYNFILTDCESPAGGEAERTGRQEDGREEGKDSTARRTEKNSYLAFRSWGRATIGCEVEQRSLVM